MQDQAELLREMMKKKNENGSAEESSTTDTRIITVASGKGGVGKTNISINLALAYALSGEPGKALQLFGVSVGKAAAYNNVGYLLMVQNHVQDAELALARALEANPLFYARANENLELLETMRRGERRTP